MKGSNFGKFQKLNQSEHDCESVPINLKAYQQKAASTSHHVTRNFDSMNAMSVGSASNVVNFSVEDELEEEMKMKEKSSFFRITSFVGIFIGVVVLLVSLSIHYTNMINEAASLKIKIPKTDTMSIYIDYETNEYKVIDNFPLLNPSVTFNTKIGNADLTEHVLAYGTYYVNVNGNGWDYLSAETVNLADYSLLESVPLSYVPPSSSRRLQDAATSASPSVGAAASAASAAHHKPVVTAEDFDDLVAQQYFRSMEAIGYLEGYATCVTMNEWYINFYSGE